ncbi:MAG: hypothetical protein JSS93_14335 [Bacteroidetes bacterium]|nr:hypothetical protein [Bacteroidota bacterium]
MAKKGTIVIKTSFDEEQQMKDAAFLKLKPTERLQIHEEMRKRIWGDKYNTPSLKGMKVFNRQMVRAFFSKAHERLLRKFLLHIVDFVLIGGHAAVFSGVRRTTADINILIRPTIEKGERIINAFKDLKLEVKGITPQDFAENNVFTFGVEPNAVDILTFSKGVFLEDIFENAIHKKIDDLKIKIINIRDLLKNKENLNRSSEKNLVDQQDILALRRILKSL